MKTCFLLQAATAVLALLPTIVFSEELQPPSSLPPTTSTVYRQVMPDGRIVYSDKLLKGARIDQTITIDPPIKGNLWSTESGAKPIVAPQVERTPVTRVPSIATPGRRKTAEEAESDVIRAEMLLEDARKKQEAGVEPLPGERTGTVSGGSRLNARYHERQKTLVREVAEAEAMLNRTRAERKALQRGR